MLVVTGGSGFLGTSVVAEALAEGRTVASVAHRSGVTANNVRTVSLDLTEPSAAERMLDLLMPSAVINCAALASVDECERDRGRAHRLNVAIPQLLARACADAGVAFVHVSTDSVFDGCRGNYAEQDTPRPLNAYAKSKLDGEHAVADAMPDALVVRTNFIGVSRHQGAGLATWIADRLAAGEAIKGFTDVVFSPLFACATAELMMEMLDLRLTGLYHLGSGDAVGKYDLAVRIARALGLDESLVEPASVRDAGLGAPRPLNTSLDSSRAAGALGHDLPCVDEAVAAFANLRRQA